MATRRAFPKWSSRLISIVTLKTSISLLNTSICNLSPLVIKHILPSYFTIHQMPQDLVCAEGLPPSFCP